MKKKNNKKALFQVDKRSRSIDHHFKQKEKMKLLTDFDAEINVYYQ